MNFMIGVDVGGTFTDFSVFNIESGELINYKSSSTPDDPSRAIVNGIKEEMNSLNAAPDTISYLVHGTTVGTNALIERKGAKVGLITTHGFKDTMEIGNQKRPSLYDLQKQKPVPLLASGCNLGVRERIIYDGSVETPLDEEDVRNAVRFLKNKGVQAIAVCTLFSFINPAHEKRIKEIVADEYPDVYVTISSELSPEFREYSRMSTTILNCYLGPVMKKYVHNFQQSLKDIGVKSEPYIAQSNGSIISIKETIDNPIRCAVSGPSAGVVAATYIGRQCGASKVITFDMGGTSADISLIEDYSAKVSNERLVEGFPARIPMINIVTIGAGGGSIARIDEGNALKVGPESAGAFPGPACYGRGGTKPVVTDANILAGKLNQKKILGGRMDVFLGKAEKAVNDEICAKTGMTIAEAANGIISVVNSNMVRAVRSVSVEKGYDVREFSLMAFGGAGPLHACEVADQLGIREVIIPPNPGTLCSLGLLLADTKFDMSRTRLMDAISDNIPQMNEQFELMIKQGTEALNRENISESDRLFEFSIDMRYQRQNFEICIPISKGILDESVLSEALAAFHAEHKRSYGYCNEKAPVQFVNFRCSAIGLIEKPKFEPAEIVEKPELPKPIETRNVLYQGYSEVIVTPVYQRDEFVPGQVVEGPCICEQMDTTLVVPPHWKLKVDGFFNIIINCKEVV